MIYLLSALILLILLIAVTVLESSRPSPFWKWLNLGLTGSGVIIVFLCHVIGNRMIAGSAQTEMWMAWAKDMLAQHYTISLPLLGVLGGILLLSWTLSLSEKRHKSAAGAFLRSAVGILASAALLLLAPLYAFMTSNETVPLDTLILISGMGEALILRFVHVLEGFCGKIR